MRETITSTEKVSISISRAILAQCYHCGTGIGWLRYPDRPADLDNIAPLAPGARPGWVCPACGRDIRAWLPDGAVIKTERGIKKC